MHRASCEPEEWFLYRNNLSGTADLHSVSKRFETEFFVTRTVFASPFGIQYRKGLRELANETNTPMTEKTDLKTQLAEVAERIRTMREIGKKEKHDPSLETNMK